MEDNPRLSLVYSFFYSRRKKIMNDSLHFTGCLHHQVVTQTYCLHSVGAEWSSNIAPSLPVHDHLATGVIAARSPSRAWIAFWSIFCSCGWRNWCLCLCCDEFQPCVSVEWNWGMALKPLPLMSTFGPLVIRKWHRRTTKRVRKDADVSCVGRKRGSLKY